MNQQPLYCKVFNTSLGVYCWISKGWDSRRKVHLYKWENPSQHIKETVSTTLQSKEQLMPYVLNNWITELYNTVNLQNTGK